MSNRFTPIGPTNDLNQLIATMNKNFAELDHEAVTKTFKGPNNTNAITLGKLADGQYGLKISDQIIFGQLPNGTIGLMILDEAGRVRVLAGEAPDGTFGLFVSKEGQDVLDAFA